MQPKANRLKTDFIIGMLCFSMLTLPYTLPKATDTAISNIVDIYSAYLNNNPFASGFFIKANTGIDINLVSKELRLVQPLVLLHKDVSGQPTRYLNVNNWFRSPFSIRSIPMFLINRYLRI